MVSKKEKRLLRGLRKEFGSVAVVFAFLLFHSPSILKSEEAAKGNLIGFVYEEDGTTPLEGAVVKIKNISTGVIYESNKSDRFGVLKIMGLENGIYTCGVAAPEGDFNLEDLVGIGVRNNETAKMSISIARYEPRLASTINEVYEEQSIAGEALIGRVVDYNPEEKLAEVFIMKGLLAVNNKIHLKGEVTDFYQKLKVLKLNGSSVKKLIAGQTGSLGMTKSVEKGDLVYLVCKRGFLPLFLAPLGKAIIITGSSLISYGIIFLERKQEASPFKR
jgi:hypothetical protein